MKGIAPNRSRGSAAALLTVAAALAALAALLASSDSARAERRSHSTTSIASVRLDPHLASRIMRTGEVDAIVTFKNADILREARGAYDSGASPVRAQVAAGSARPNASRTQRLAIRAAIDLLASRYNAMKDRVLARARDDVEVLRKFRYLPSAFVRFRSVAALAAVASSRDVLSVSEPATYRLAGNDTDQESLPLIHADQTAAAGNMGAETYVAVLDTGADYTRSAFGSCTAPYVPSSCKIFFAKEYGLEQDGTPDDDGHGTNVSGIVAAVAPATRIFALDVFTPGEKGLEAKEEDISAALNDVISWKKQDYNIRAVNMSFGWPVHENSTCTTNPKGQANPSAPLFKQLRDLKILPVVAAGNNGYVYGVPEEGVAYPACTAGALSVGAVYDSPQGIQGFGEESSVCWDWTTDTDQITCFSQSGPTLSLLAPGAWIDAAGISDAGTSQAAPHVTGAVAVLAAARPAATADQIQTALMTTGPLVSDDRFDGPPTHRLDVAAALAALPAADSTLPVVSSVTQIMPSTLTSAGTAVDTFGRVLVKASWSATDTGGSGLAGYEVQVNTNGAWTALATSGTATSAGIALAASMNTYQFAVRARDAAGNVGAWLLGSTFKLTAYQEDNASIVYGGSWTRFAWASAWGGYEKTSGTAGNTAQLTFTGRNVAWVAPTAINRGQASVYIDGALVKSLDLYSSMTLARVVDFSYYWASNGTHTIRVEAAGTAGRPSIDVDGFIVMS